jgi:tetratricopeptide (TPR) repeat protein
MDADKVHWLLRALRQLKAALARPLSKSEFDCGLCFGRRELSKLIAETFQNASAVIVRRRLHGYREKRKPHVFLVEAMPEDPFDCSSERSAASHPHVHIVKIGDPGELARELSGWRRCALGVMSDSTLVPLQCGVVDPVSGRPRTLVYEDAYQMIGGGDVITLEEAVLGSCRWNTPTVDSIRHSLTQVYGRLDSLLYHQSFVPEPTLPKLAQWLEPWDEKRPGDARLLALRGCRRETYGFLSRKRDTFLDPADYLRSVVACPQFLPRMIRGCAHGDLHGLNILIGLEEETAVSPAVFDYEDMGNCELLAWDFVKLETELKVRALQAVFPGAESEFVEAVHQFEVQLAERTEDANDQKADWVSTDEGDTPRQRLTAILLQIRERAKRHLGTLRHREREWLEEYYFLLACYGVYTGKFETYHRRHSICAYISAGVAARRLSRPRALFATEVGEMERQAEQTLEQGEGALKAHVLTPGECEMSHHARFAFAQRWARSENVPFMKTVIGLLEQIRDDFPHVLEIEEELALTHLHLKEDDDAEESLQRVNPRYRNCHWETYCRWGRLWKDRAARAAPGSAEVHRFLHTALAQYEKARGFGDHYYPKINVAGLHYILGNVEDAKKLAQELVDTLTDGDDPVWPVATRADAYVLLGDQDEAEEQYRSAVSQRSVTPQHRKAMRRQIELIVKLADHQLRAYWTDEKLDAVFGPDTREEGDPDSGSGAAT